MTPNDHDTDQAQAPASADKVLDHTRLQLSALIDGALPLDEARFLLRRLEHDGELRDCWERWQLCGDVLRARVGVYAQDGLADRIAHAVAAEPKAPRDTAGDHRRWWRLGSGAALAASVAMIALFLTRQSPEIGAPASRAPAQVAANPVPAPVQLPVRPMTTAPVPSAPGQAAEVASALAVADVPRRLATRRSRGQSQRAALRSPARVEAPVAVAAATPFATSPAVVDPFSGQHVRLPNRPWPRALLPTAAANGAFTVDYGSRMDIAGRPLSPFVPRPLPRSLQAAPEEASDAGPPTP